MSERAEATKTHPLYTVLLGLTPVLLTIIGYLTVSKFDSVETGMHVLVTTTNDLKGQMASMQATIDAWARQGFVSRDLFEALKSEYERRIAALESRKG